MSRTTYSLTIPEGAKYSISYNEELDRGSATVITVTGYITNDNWQNIPNLEELLTKYEQAPDKTSYSNIDGWLLINTSASISKLKKALNKYGELATVNQLKPRIYVALFVNWQDANKKVLKKGSDELGTVRKLTEEDVEMLK